MRKLAILTPTFCAFSGIDRVVALQAEQYVKKGWEVHVFALQATLPSKKYKVHRLGLPKSRLGQVVYRLFFPWFPHNWHVSRKLKSFDRVIAHLYPMTWIASGAKKEYGIDYWYHNHGINVSESHGSFLQEIYMKLFLKFSNKSLENVDRAASVSKFLQQELKSQSGVLSKVEYNPIDTTLFKKGITTTQLRKKLNLDKKKIVLYVGRIAPHKRVHELVHLVKQVKKTIPNAHLIVVGKPTFEEYVAQITHHSKGSVTFAGVVSDKELAQYYTLADVYATCSHWEGYDLPIVQAAACGTPSVAYDIGSHSEVLKKGTLVKKGDKKKFVQALISQLKK